MEFNYNIPSNNRELQPSRLARCAGIDYNIPSNNRELQLRLLLPSLLTIITYQVITGNYSKTGLKFFKPIIITYQVITGNYSLHPEYFDPEGIITYQVITGNYSRFRK